VAVEFPEIDDTPAVEFSHTHIFVRVGTAAVLEPLGLDTAKNGIEFVGTHMERVVMHFDWFAAVVEVKGEVLVDRDRNERTIGITARQTEDLREELADASLSCAGTMVWSRTMAMTEPPDFHFLK